MMHLFFTFETHTAILWSGCPWSLFSSPSSSRRHTREQVHNKSLESHIQGFKGPKDASDLALATIIAWLDNTDTL